MSKYINIVKDHITFYTMVVRDLFGVSKSRTIIMLVMSIVLPFVSVVELELNRYIVDQASGESPIDEQWFKRIIGFVLLSATAILCFTLARSIVNIINNRFAKKVIMKKKGEFLTKISRVSYECFENADFHQKIWIAGQAPDKYIHTISYISSFISTALYFVIYSIMLVRINFIFVFLLIITLIVYMWVQKRNSNKWEDYYDHLLAPEERMSSYFEDILANRVNHSTIQINRLLPFFLGKYEKHADNERKFRLKINILSYLTEIAMSVIFLTMMIVMLSYTATGVIHQDMSIGSYTLMISVMMELFVLFNVLTDQIFSEKEHMKFIKTYHEIMELSDDNGPEIEQNTGILAVKDICYRYPQAQAYALDRVTCEFRQGEKIALVGLNGSGKTTFVHVLMGLLNCNSGFCSNGVGSTVAIMQDFQSYQLTVKENIEIGQRGVPMNDDEVWELLKKVELFEYIKSLPDGIHTKIGQLEDGVELSKGQFQRLALARMLANQDAKVWILDEPTAFLDPISEIKMYEHILSLAGDRLVFFISHRLGFAKKADRIMVMGDGTVVEIGTHDELMEKENGVYRTMYDSQCAWYVS